MTTLPSQIVLRFERSQGGQVNHSSDALPRRKNNETGETNKRTVHGCGRRTEAIALKHDGARVHFGLDQIESVERLVEEFEQYGIGLLSQLVCWDVSDEDAKKELGKVPETLKEFRNQYSALM